MSLAVGGAILLRNAIRVCSNCKSSSTNSTLLRIAKKSLELREGMYVTLIDSKSRKVTIVVGCSAPISSQDVSLNAGSIFHNHDCDCELDSSSPSPGCSRSQFQPVRFPSLPPSLHPSIKCKLQLHPSP